MHSNWRPGLQKLARVCYSDRNSNIFQPFIGTGFSGMLGLHTSGTCGSTVIPNFRERNKEIIANILDMPLEKVSRAPKKEIIEHSAQDVYKILQDNRFGSGEVLRYPDLFMMSPGAVTNYIEIMKESYFREIRLKLIINFTTIHKRTLEFLRDKCLIPAHPEIVRNYCKILGISGTKTEDCIWTSLPLDISRVTLGQLRKVVMAQYIASRLDIEVPRVEAIFPLYRRLEYRCMKWVKRSLSLVKDGLELPVDKIINHAYLLHGNPANTSKILREIHSLSGIPIRELLLSRPKILMSTKESLLEIQELFRQHNISTEAILKHPEIYTICPSTLNRRLQEFDIIPELRPLKSHPRVARLLYYQEKVKRRLKYLNSVNVAGVSLDLLSSDTKRFNKLTSGEIKTRGKDVIIYLTEYLSLKGVLKEDVRSNIMRQPNWLHANVVSVKESTQFIDSFNIFSKSQIFSALPLLLYPKQKIATQFEKVIDSEEAKLTDEYFLHMVLYFLERIVHFSGDGLWEQNTRIPMSIDDDDQSTVGSDSSESDSHALDEDHDELELGESPGENKADKN